jgi:hypothetical protein
MYSGEYDVCGYVDGYQPPFTGWVRIYTVKKVITIVVNINSLG